MNTAASRKARTHRTMFIDPTPSTAGRHGAGLAIIPPDGGRGPPLPRAEAGTDHPLPSPAGSPPAPGRYVPGRDAGSHRQGSLPGAQAVRPVVGGEDSVSVTRSPARPGARALLAWRGDRFRLRLSRPRPP